MSVVVFGLVVGDVVIVGLNDRHVGDAATEGTQLGYLEGIADG